VPREAFIPRLVWRDEDGVGVPVDRDADPEAWAALLYDEYASIVTQLDDGAASGAGRFTSSSSMPIVMARMLAVLPAEPRGRVLEVSTGTGYNDAVLAEYYGAPAVTSIGVDPSLAERADKARRSGPRHQGQSSSLWPHSGTPACPGGASDTSRSAR
jgi:protein-L-isoaspartate O-methyltransferase